MAAADDTITKFSMNRILRISLLLSLSAILLYVAWRNPIAPEKPPTPAGELSPKTELPLAGAPR